MPTPSGSGPRKATRRARTPDAPTSSHKTYGASELIVVAYAEAGLRVRAGEVASVRGARHRQLTEVAVRDDVSMTPLFGPEDRVARMADAAAPRALAPIPDLTVYYHVDGAATELDELAERFDSVDEIAGAYVKPPGEPPVRTVSPPSAEAAPAITPNFEARQGYLDAAPGGVDARYAWTFPGGGGQGVSIIDCEWGWRFDHEDLNQVQGGVVIGTADADTDHGTAVIGALSGDRNTFGITGICPEAMISAAAFSGPTAATIRAAASRLQPGDLLLLEIHRAGPRDGFRRRADQFGYIAIEWWPDDLAAIQFATSQGIIVVEAAGNGAQDLDDTLYSTPAKGFPKSWVNPFARTTVDSGAIVVGAGAPPPGTHERSHGADRSRLDFSNHGGVVDAQGWGEEVTSTGYGDLQRGGDARFFYTDTFNGTSSASPIVTGVLASLQGARRAAGASAMTPQQARQWLRTSGTPQTDEPGRPATQRIGNRPDLRELIDVHVTGKVDGFEMGASLGRRGFRTASAGIEQRLAYLEAVVEVLTRMLRG